MSKNDAKGTTEKIIRINLDHGDSNRPLGPDELIQKASYDKLKKQILSDIEKIQPLSREHPDGYPAGNGFSYFIDGTRGAGKSTFLQSIVSALPADLKESQKRVVKLAYIDPSRIEDTEIILLLVLKALKKEVEGVAQHYSLSDEVAASNFRQHFKELAGGLSLFVPDHHPLNDLDPELFLDWGLERAGHSVDLRRNLHQVIESACAILKVDALILAFDDAEINGKHANDVLECVRKYLDTPRLLVFVTGDIELYSLQLRGKFRKDIRGVSVDHGDSAREKQRSRMVDHLEDQYLLKLFPIRRRVQLRPLWNLLEQNVTTHPPSDQYYLAYGEWKDDRPLEEVIHELIKFGLRIGNTRDIALYKQFLLKQPLRSILQILARCADFLPISEPDIIFPITESVRESLRAVALGALYKFGVDVDGIAANELPALIEAVFDLSILEGDVDTSAYLRPQSNDLSIRNSTGALSADVLSFCNGNPAAVLQYMFSAPGSVALFGQVLKREERKTGGRSAEHDKVELIRQFKQYMGIGRKESTLNWTRHATALLSPPNKVKRKAAEIDFGVFALHRKKPKGAKVAQKTYSEVIDQLIVSARPLPTFALSLIDTSGVNGTTFASIFNILGLMERLLGIQKSEWTAGAASDFLPKSYPPLSISPPEWEGRSAMFDEVEEDKEKISLDSESGPVAHLGDLSESIAAWLQNTASLRRRIALPAVVIGKIWTRLYFSLEKVSENQRSKAKAATLMELFALCVINAFFVEESEHYFSFHPEKGPDSVLDRTNPLTSPKALTNKFRNNYVSRESLPMTAIIATCPLILGLLKRENRHEDYLVRLTAYPTTNIESGASGKGIIGRANDSLHADAKSEICRALCDAKIFEEINRILIVGAEKGEGSLQARTVKSRNAG